MNHKRETPITLFSKEAAACTPLTYLVFILFLGFLLAFYLLLSLRMPVLSVFSLINLFTACFIFLASAWIAVSWKLKKWGPEALKISAIVLSPLLLLGVIIPYFYLSASSVNLSPCAILGLILLCQFRYFLILQENHSTDPRKKVTLEWVLITLLALFYTFVLSHITISQYHNWGHFNPSDLALYNQILWNNLHGYFFENSTSGSNFVTHNSPFWLLLTPLYAILPAPETLLFLKTLFLALSIIPFYLIARDILNKQSALVLTCGFMLFPFLIAQNFSAPHEVCFLPPFLLFSFYFFTKNRFGWFLLFLLLCLSIKEHLSLLAIAYGFYAALKGKERKWVFLPILVGVAWGIFSLWVIGHYQQIYVTDPHPAWFIENLKMRFLDAGLLEGLKTSNLGSLHQFLFTYQLISPLAILFPFFSSLFFLALPELTINLLSDRLIFFPIWHYNILVSCFLFLGTLEAIRKISAFKIFERISVSTVIREKLLSWLVFFCVLSHYFLWIDLTVVREKGKYKKAVEEAVALLPKKASVSASGQIAPFVSSRKEYFLISDRRTGEYILINDEDLNLADGKIKSGYLKIFDKRGIKLFRKINAQ